jgi:hypothetical protein
MVDPLAEIDGTGRGDDDDGVVVAGCDVVDEFVSAIGELREEKTLATGKGKGKRGKEGERTRRFLRS